MAGKPLGDIKLTLDAIMGEDWINSTNYIQVDQDGRFIFHIPAWDEYHSRQPDTVRYRVIYYGRVGEHVRHANTPIIALRPGEEQRGVVLDLRRDVHPLRLRATDIEGKPIYNAGISVFIRFEDDSAHGLVDVRDEDSNVYTNMDGLTPLLYLSSYAYRFQTRADGFAPISSYLDIPEELPAGGILDIRMQKGGRITGKVVYSDGTPVPNASVAIRYYADDASGLRFGIGKDFHQKPTLGDAQTGEDGRFALTMLYPVGNYCIQAFHPDYGVGGKIDVPVGSEDVIFQLKPVVSLVGRVVKGDGSVSDGLVYANLLKATAEYKVFEDGRIRPGCSALSTDLLEEIGYPDMRK